MFPAMQFTASRRAFVAGGALAALGLVRTERAWALIDEVARRGLPGGGGRFLSGPELTTLRALTARLVPGPPHDPGPGALEVHAAEAIDLLLGAFEFDPPLIHAGGPFSGRAGGSRDEFAHFVRLDPQAALGWRIRLEGSRGLPEREFAGPVIGLQEIYRDGLAKLNALARSSGGRPFADVPTTTQDSLLAVPDPEVGRLVTTALANTLEALCGPPEYGGNHGLAGWRGLNWRGDAEPDGFTPAQVSEPDPSATAVATVSEADRRAALARLGSLAGAASAQSHGDPAAGGT
jgi:Gluconate 2-dehydrogenase subunit 3